MPGRIQISEHIAAGVPPSDEGLRQLKEDGFRSVVDAATAEAGRPGGDAERESRRVRGQGLEFARAPITLYDNRHEDIDGFRRRLLELPLPVYLASAQPEQAAALAVMHLASEKGMSGAEARHWARNLGIGIGEPSLPGLIQNYVDLHARQGPPVPGS